MFQRRLLILLSAFIVALSGCKKQDPGVDFEQTAFVKEGLTVDEDSALASLPSYNFTPAEIMLDDSETVEQFLTRTDPLSLPNWGHRTSSPTGVEDDTKKHRFAADMYSMAASMANNFTPHIEGTDKKQQPDQIGYGYVWNTSMDLTTRKKAGQCEVYLYGIDCSGMVTLMLGAALHRTLHRYEANSLATEAVLNGFLKSTPGYENFEYEDVDDPVSFSSKMTEGDIIYFSRTPDGDAFHIGVALNRAGFNQIWVYQSNGTDEKPDCGTKFSNQDKRGPRAMPLRDYNTSGTTVLGILDLKYKDDVKNNEKKIIHHKGDKVYPYYGILHLKTGDKPTQLDMLTKNLWKYSNENSSVSTGGHKLPIHENSVDAHDLTLKFDADYHFTFNGVDDDSSPFSEAGTFAIINDGKAITESGAELYGEDPINAELVTLTDNELTLKFTILHDGFTQISILYFKK